VVDRQHYLISSINIALKLKKIVVLTKQLIGHDGSKETLSMK